MELQEACEKVSQDILRGQVVPFLGAGINLCGRQPGETYLLGKRLPSGKELAEILGTKFGYPGMDKDNLLRVSWYVAAKEDKRELYNNLQDIFSPEYPTNPVHNFFASLPKKLKDKGHPNPHQLIITTNYDDVLERAFKQAQEPFDVVYYVAEGENSGRFVHLPYQEQPNPNQKYPEPIENLNDYDQLPIDIDGNLGRTIILKIHGAVGKIVSRSSFVITEDDYIDYLARLNAASSLPKTLEAKMKDSRFLFLGYSLSDWNLRVILQRIWKKSTLPSKSRAILKEAELIDIKYWESRGVEFAVGDLEEFIPGLDGRVDHELNKAGGGV